MMLLSVEKSQESEVVAIENKEGRSGFVAMEVIDSVSKDNLKDFAQRKILNVQNVSEDAYPANNGIKKHPVHT